MLKLGFVAVVVVVVVIVVVVVVEEVGVGAVEALVLEVPRLEALQVVLEVNADAAAAAAVILQKAAAAILKAPGS